MPHIQGHIPLNQAAITVDLRHSGQLHHEISDDSPIQSIHRPAQHPYALEQHSVYQLEATRLTRSQQLLHCFSLLRHIKQKQPQHQVSIERRHYLPKLRRYRAVASASALRLIASSSSSSVKDFKPRRTICAFTCCCKTASSRRQLGASICTRSPDRSNSTA